MALAVLVDKLVIDMILRMYFPHGIVKSIVGSAILILNIMFDILSQLNCFINKNMCNWNLIDTAIEGQV